MSMKRSVGRTLSAQMKLLSADAEVPFFFFICFLKQIWCQNIQNPKCNDSRLLVFVCDFKKREIFDYNFV